MPNGPQLPWSMDSWVVHGGRPAVQPGQPVNQPIEPASTYYAGGEPEYARDGTRGMQALEAAIGPMEGGQAVAYSSGMAAANAIIDLLPMGAIVVAARFTYTGVSVRLRELHESGRLQLRHVDIADTDAVLRAADGAQALWVETPTNPMLEVADIPALRAGTSALLIVDNTFATPLGQQPLLCGADVVMHSATKAIGGHSDGLMGLAITADPERAEALRIRRTILGGAPGALECYLTLRGLRTLSLRHARSQQSAQMIAERLTDHPSVRRVRFPGLPADPGFERMQRLMNGPGSIMAVEVYGGAAAAQRVAEATKLWVHATSLGGVESLIERRRRWPLENSEVPEDLLRLSVGIEDCNDLWDDLDQALRS